MITRTTCAWVLATALSFGVAGDLWAGPTNCTDSAIGGQTGMTYELVGQELVTETTTTTIRTGASLLWGFIRLDDGIETTVETTVEYYRGTYQAANGTRVQVNCSTGSVV